MLDAFWVTSTPATLGQKLRERFDGLVARLVVHLPYAPTAQRIAWPCLVQELAAQPRKRYAR